jgi:hypothetical protein
VLKIIENEKFSIFFTLVIVVLGISSLARDLMTPNETYWFQRSGALLVLAGVGLQYSRINALWQSEMNREKEIESVASRIESGNGINMKELAEESQKTRAFALRIFDTVTTKSIKEVIAVSLIVGGTIIWGYGDLPFK